MGRQRLLSQNILDGFDKYTYNCIDTSVLSQYVMHPFWNWCIQFCPRWVAPNLLTFSGFMLTAANFALFAYYDYHFDGVSDSKDLIPSWVWLASAVNLFVAYTLDGIDGKQARRTGTSGPLGELFDHGLDSYSTVLISTCLYSIFGRQEIGPLRMHFILWNIFINFYLTHWEKYNTRVMFLPWGYDFTMLGSVLALLATWFGTPAMWRVSLPGGMSAGNLFEITLYSSAALTSQTIILYNIYKSYRDKTGKMHPFGEAVRPLVPMVAFFTLTTLWAVYSPTDIIGRHPRMFYLTTGTIFSNISCRLIVSQMSDTRSDIYNSLLGPYALAVLVSLAFNPSRVNEPFLLYALGFYSTYTHVMYGAGVVTEMCNHFKIKCFQIKHENK